MAGEKRLVQAKVETFKNGDAPLVMCLHMASATHEGRPVELYSDGQVLIIDDIERGVHHVDLKWLCEAVLDSGEPPAAARVGMPDEPSRSCPRHPEADYSMIHGCSACWSNAHRQPLKNASWIDAHTCAATERRVERESRLPVTPRQDALAVDIFNAGACSKCNAPVTSMTQAILHAQGIVCTTFMAREFMLDNGAKYTGVTSFNTGVTCMVCGEGPLEVKVGATHATCSALCGAQFSIQPAWMATTKQGVSDE